MKLSELKPLVPFTVTGSMRYGLHCIKVTPQYREATNGHIIVRIENESDTTGFVDRRMFNGEVENVEIESGHVQLKAVQEGIKWPDTNALFELVRTRKEGATGMVRLDSRYLSMIADVLDVLRDDHIPSAEFHFPEKQNDALYVVSKTADGKKIEIVVMPGPDFAF